MALQLDRRRISVKGGGVLKVREIDPTPAASFSDLGFVKESTFKDEHSMVESIDDAGRYVDTKSGGQKVVWETTLMQTTKDEIDLMRNAEGRYYEAYYLVQLNNGSYQEYLFPVCRIKPGAELSFQAATERNIKIEIHALACKVALTRTPSSWNTSQWATYALQENVSPANAPSDAGTVPQAAI